VSFLSAQFLCFLVATWVLFLICPANKRWLLLLCASYIFYATWSIPFIGVILLTTTIDYVASRIVYNNASLSTKRAALWIAVVANLMVLGAFKYFNFFLQTQAKLCGIWGCTAPLPEHLNIVLPLGISFYTFEAISYLVDTYRGAKPAPEGSRAYSAWLSFQNSNC
jgi:alginate O-acetyltransferase complex protein AlgI